MDPATVAILIGLGTLLIERGFKWAYKIQKSNCCCDCIKIEMSSNESSEK